ncbi:MAG: gliding motility-associated C-terminal domain-containing protein [Bacteroidales bacterium]
MLKRYPYVLLFSILISSALMVSGQMPMPDNVNIGQTRHYNVDPNPVPGSNYTWWIDGVVQAGITTSAMDHTWNTEGTFLLEVQEITANGCPGPRRSGQVIVNASSTTDICLLIPDAFSPNNDLINDTWNIRNIEFYPDVEITIYNRWGQIVWESERGYPSQWDGRSKGIDLPVDAYHFVIDLHNGTSLFVGDITIVR